MLAAEPLQIQTSRFQMPVVSYRNLPCADPVR